MKDGPDIARIAALIGDTGRANMLTALLSGKALTATELAAEAGITVQTASSHLAKMTEGGLLGVVRSGRHKYFSLAGEGVAGVLEGLMGLAAASGHLRSRPGPRDPELRRARVCYNHLAGDMGVRLYESMRAQSFLALTGAGLDVTDAGRAHLTGLGLPPECLLPGRAPICKECLDWSERRAHLAGRLGRALFDHFIADGWISRVEGSRVVKIHRRGEAGFARAFPLRSAAQRRD